jgi:hypothetical protein
LGTTYAGRIAETEKFRNNQLLKNLQGAGLVDAPQIRHRALKPTSAIFTFFYLIV